MEKKIIVTGATGYIGSHTVVELVNAGYMPVLIDNFSNSYQFILHQIETITGKKLSFYDIDCTNSALESVFEKEENIAGVIHFAAYKAVGESVAQPLKYYHNNVGSLLNIMNIMEKFKVTNLVFSSSCTVYGEPDALPVTELSSIKKANSPYGNTKQICEEIITDYINSGASYKASLLRYFNPVGAHPSGLLGELPIGSPNNLIPFITQTAAGLREKLTVFGSDYNTVDGSCVRDYIHVVDLAKAHVKALELCFHQKSTSYLDTFNLGTGKGSSVLGLVSLFEQVAGQKLNFEVGPRRPGDVEQIYAEVTKANTVLNWKTELSLKHALEDAWRWQLNLKDYEQQFK